MTKEKVPYTRVAIEPGSRLEQLFAEYDRAKSEAVQAAAREKHITDAIKAELAAAAPDATRITAYSTAAGLALKLVGAEQWRVDSTRLRAEQPLIFSSYAKKSTVWTLSRDAS